MANSAPPADPPVARVVADSMAREIVQLRELTNQQAQQIVVLTELLAQRLLVPA